MKASIVMPAYNKGSRLRILLESLARQDYPKKDFEVLVSDDGSTDDTTAVLDAYRDRLPLRAFFQQNKGTSAALNLAIREATGDLILMCDGDMVMPRGWIREHVKLHTRYQRITVIGAMSDTNLYLPPWMPPRIAHLIQGKVRAGNPRAQRLYNATLRAPGQRARARSKSFEWDLQTLYQEGFPYHNTVIGARYGEELKELAIPWVLYLTGNVSMRREDMLKVGGMEERFAGWGLEDVELGYRLFESGVKLRFSAAAWNCHQAHARNWERQEDQLRKNFDLFYQLHPTESVRLHWDYIMGSLGLEAYNEAIAGNAYA